MPGSNLTTVANPYNDHWTTYKTVQYTLGSASVLSLIPVVYVLLGTNQGLSCSSDVELAVLWGVFLLVLTGFAFGLFLELNRRYLYTVPEDKAVVRVKGDVIKVTKAASAWVNHRVKVRFPVTVDKKRYLVTRNVPVRNLYVLSACQRTKRQNVCYRASDPTHCDLKQNIEQPDPILDHLRIALGIGAVIAVTVLVNGGLCDPSNSNVLLAMYFSALTSIFLVFAVQMGSFRAEWAVPREQSPVSTEDVELGNLQNITV
jgi:hypothetical protein